MQPSKDIFGSDFDDQNLSFVQVEALFPGALNELAGVLSTIDAWQAWQFNSDLRRNPKSSLWQFSVSDDGLLCAGMAAMDTLVWVDGSWYERNPSPR